MGRRSKNQTDLLLQIDAIARNLLELITLCIKRDENSIQSFKTLSGGKENVFSAFVKLNAIATKLLKLHNDKKIKHDDERSKKKLSTIAISDQDIEILKAFLKKRCKTLNHNNEV